MARSGTIDRFRFHDMRPGLRAPRARVHRKRAADRARDSGEEIRRPELPLRALATDPRAWNPGLRAHAILTDAIERVQDSVHRNHDAADAAVAHEQVAAEPDPGDRNS